MNSAPPHVCSGFGWDQVTQGLVKLGFYFMDTFGPKPGPFGKTTEGAAAMAQTPTQLACKLGRQVLLLAFKVTSFILGESNMAARLYCVFSLRMCGIIF